MAPIEPPQDIARFQQTGPVFDEPFAYLVNNPNVNTFCSYCARKPDGAGSKTPAAKLSLCGNCEFARYCNRDCQRAAWRTHHKLECPRLKRSFPNLPLSEVMFMTRIIDRLQYIEANGDTQNWQKHRKWSELMDHMDDIRQDQLKMEHFEKLYTKCAAFMGDDMPDKDKFFTIFGKTWINSHAIHTMVGDEVGVALDLGVSRYDHSCRPTVSLVFDGFKCTLRPLTQGIDLYNHTQAFISYVDVGRSRYLRQKDLKAKWYFDCLCERCQDPKDDKLTSLVCVKEGCPGNVLVTEVTEPGIKYCELCATEQPLEHVKAGIELMNAMPAKFDLKANDEDKARMRKQLGAAKGLLHNDNIYYCRTLTAYMQLAPDDKEYANDELHKLVYTQYKSCFPESDRHRGYQMLHLVKTFIGTKRRQEAIPYAYEAMTIFEVCFGLDHPYYLQTLALWTFLKDNRTDKTDDELYELMNFNYHQKVDLSPYLNIEALNKLNRKVQQVEETD